MEKKDLDLDTAQIFFDTKKITLFLLNLVLTERMIICKTIFNTNPPCLNNSGHSARDDSSVLLFSFFSFIWVWGNSPNSIQDLFLILCPVITPGVLRELNVVLEIKL